ncbi:hypothetical protein EVAR_78814_1 [Eumeta japonica]|uniref:C2 domain-containing protein n=1 Tax=Eumeta variegata TaxID=151549 RepID=A0A4C1T2A7_EUMVA|nr:hypothetical protein EVAR_78814_1 [Eumeta japonica]
MAQNWFKRFQSGNFDVKDEPRSGRPVTDKDDAILEQVEQGRHINSYDIVEELGIGHETVFTHLEKARYLGPTRALKSDLDQNTFPAQWSAAAPRERHQNIVRNLKFNSNLGCERIKECTQLKGLCPLFAVSTGKCMSVYPKLVSTGIPTARVLFAASRLVQGHGVVPALKGAPGPSRAHCAFHVKMLKWAVYGKRNQDLSDEHRKTHDILESHADNYDSKTRKSLDACTQNKSKKPIRYQRRSLGSNTRKNNSKSTDKENLNFIGNTPNYFKEGFIRKKIDVGLALKDVSNTTPTPGESIRSKNVLGARQACERKRYYISGSTEALPPDLPPTPPTYSRRIREAKKRKLEMTSVASSDLSFNRNNINFKSERRNEHNIDKDPVKRGSLLNRTQSEPSLNNLSERLNASINSHRHSVVVAKQQKKLQAVNTTKSSSEGLVEIEYDKNLVLNCVEKPLVDVTQNHFEKKSTLPIFGNHVFMKNPLYFKRNDLDFDEIRQLKRTREKSNEFESSFKSPSVDKRDVHSLIRDGCSPACATPLSVKLADLRFSTLSTHIETDRIDLDREDADFFPRIENPFIISLRDEENSAEMENKYILLKENTNETESTVSTTHMGDITLERMIEDIIKSTKKVKTRRKAINTFVENKKDEGILRPCSLFVNTQAKHKTNLIREAKCVNLSRENSVSPKYSPPKGNININYTSFHKRIIRSLSKEKSFILAQGNGCNEREVKTPDTFEHKTRLTNQHMLNRSQSMKHNSIRTTIGCISSESTPDLYNALQDTSIRLKRQRGVRRKKSSVSRENLWNKQPIDLKSVLTLEMAIPDSNVLEENDVLECDRCSFDYIVESSRGDIYGSDRQRRSSLTSIDSDVGLKYLNPYMKSRDGLRFATDNEMTSLSTHAANLKKAERQLKCLTYSPEEGSISSADERRRSVASGRLEGADKFHALKGTIDLEIVTNNDVIDVHVIRCRDLQRSSGKTDDINAYAKVVISGVAESQSLSSQRSVFQRTSVLYGRREPEFQRHLKLPLPAAICDDQTIHISVWHRDKKYRHISLSYIRYKGGNDAGADGTCAARSIGGRGGAQPARPGSLARAAASRVRPRPPRAASAVRQRRTDDLVLTYRPPDTPPERSLGATGTRSNHSLSQKKIKPPIFGRRDHALTAFGSSRPAPGRGGVSRRGVRAHSCAGGRERDARKLLDAFTQVLSPVPARTYLSIGLGKYFIGATGRSGGALCRIAVLLLQI